MKKFILLIMTAPIWMGCSNNDDADSIDCSLIDLAFPTLFVKIVDSTGANKIENGTIDPENIQVEGDFTGAGFRFVPENEFANPDAEIRQFDNTLNLFIPYQPTFTYHIHLNDTETVNINFKAELTETLCNITYYKPTAGVFNGEEVTLDEIFGLHYLVTITL